MKTLEEAKRTSRLHWQFRQPKPWRQYCNENILDSYCFGVRVALNNFPQQQDPATTTVNDGCAQVHSLTAHFVPCGNNELRQR